MVSSVLPVVVAPPAGSPPEGAAQPEDVVEADYEIVDDSKK